ncbi:hypothetical protein KQI88_15940 [Alkaliphilus sp. MSJ-5]|uniref:Phage protein n=1 Tax=Alkaliphilus flagellatus TaxID=2841507 RepID=A0ABS6G694_9FIRM|nr:hypothetical protein [Alkaliphilus flagellatus]MBU5677909.1 hypothetical protein [Alkaliphilus flagellatus]
MYDIKPTINKLLEEIVGEDSVSDAYPEDFNNLPHISFYEQSNNDYLKKGPELLTEIVIQIDIWHNRSTGALAQQVNNKMNSIGFRREFMRDIPDPNVKHKTMRFKGIVDKRSLLVYQ